MKRLILLLVFMVFSFVIVDNAPAPPFPGGNVPVGGAIPSGVAIAAIAAYGIWRMRDK